ncbi:type III secretion system inner membrane ring lipoprotein SctJ [Limnobacter sp.]|uniref:type III secretion system inner membrane ring lipoprotein SctJ n=1 Tax=Limnobacter sp. TaxID=2003368 RepID=UPI0035180678
MLLAILLHACSSNTVLFSALEQDEANQIYSTLLEVGIPAERETTKTGVTVTVPRSMSSEALKILQSKGLPRDKKSSMGEVFRKESMISSPLEERARYLYALSQELERTLMRMDGVISSRVHIVLPERTNPGEPLTPSSAAVFVKYDQRTSFQAYIPRVRELVFNSIPGLSGDAHTAVSVAAVPAENLQENCIALLWYGPVAIHPSDRWVFLTVMYLIIGLWCLSITMVWLQARDVKDWPETLKKLHAKFNKE